MGIKIIDDKSHGEVTAKEGYNYRIPYEHQKNAMQKMDDMNKKDSFSSLVVLPTGGGKTFTASTWLLRNALDKKKKILWIAHRQMLLDQAAESFINYAYPENMPDISSFDFRIISGSPDHGRTIDITAEDDLLIASKDSLGRNLVSLDEWLDGVDELYFVIDEAHHATAKTYRRIIDHVKAKVKHVKLFGLTATPERTAESEKGLLAKIFTDGIAYQISLKELITKGILAHPYIEKYETKEAFGGNMGIKDLEKITNFDILPEKVANSIIKNAARNQLIVDTYVKNKEKYGQTLVFAINVDHAISLAGLFDDAGVNVDYVVSNIRDLITGVTKSNKENELKIEKFKNGKLDVLINVNILTEGVDLPKVQTVFLARPTVSTILMTQMVGRALRGVKAGGTDKAYIVSFVDDWNENVMFVSPDSLFIDPQSDFTENETERREYEVRLISISKIQEFAKMMSNEVDRRLLANVPFEQRIPMGMYAFSYQEPNEGADYSYQVMVYDSTKKAYEDMLDSLPDLFEEYKIGDAEFLSSQQLDEMSAQIENTFFLGQMIPPFDEKDIKHILKFYAQHESKPIFYSFDAIEKSKIDVSLIAKHIWEEDMGERRKAEYIDELWNSTDENLLKLFFGRKIYFRDQLNNEIYKLHDPNIFNENVVYDQKKKEDMSLEELREYYPDYEKELRDGAFERSMQADGQYRCAHCGKTAKNRIPFQVDHIIPMNKGGKSIRDNLQVLCMKCNARKGDKLEENK